MFFTMKKVTVKSSLSLGTCYLLPPTTYKGCGKGEVLNSNNRQTTTGKKEEGKIDLGI